MCVNNSIDRQMYYVGIFGLLIISFFFYFYTLTHPVCCDANEYINLANSIHDSGLESFRDQVRTWGYPWLLSILISFSKIVHLPFNLIVFFFQIVFYYFSILFFCKSIASLGINRNTVSFIYLFLCLNFFAIPYSIVTLTDSVYLTLSLLFFSQVFTLFRNDIRDKTNILLWALFIICCSVAIRPAAIWMTIPYVYLWLFYFSKGGVNFIKFTALSVFSSFPIVLQLIINISQFGKYSIFPVIDLGSLQIKWGIEYLKYGTWLGGGPPQNYYPSSALIDNTDSDIGVVWYFYNFFDGIKLLLFKFVGSFDFDYLVPYAYSKPYIPYIPSFVSFVLLWIGLLTIFFHLFSNKIPVIGPKLLPFLVLFSWGGVSLLSAIELRFTLPLLMYFIIISPIFYEFVYSKSSSKMKLFYILGGMFFVTFCTIVALFVRSQSSILDYVYIQ
ncbi:hypothetical protein VCSRO25_2834 [Vibrio cholerae]|nr:hypothetical protein VCSRO25_2834 [Vibrio cholerae]